MCIRDSKWLEGVVFPPLEKGKKLFVGLSKGNAIDVIYDEYLAKIPEAKKLDLTGKHLFITSKYCVETLKNSNLPEGLWAAGVKSTRELVEKGFWVNGSADSLGTDDLKCLRTSRALQMIHPHLGEKWNVLSHHLATSDMGQVIGCYERVEKKLPDGFEEKLHQVGACYWTSYPQYLSYMLRFPFLHQAKHFCGLGKTWQEFKEANIKVHPMASMEDFYGLRK